MTLVAGVDSSTQSCKVVIRNSDTGSLVRFGVAPHPQGTQINPHEWEIALHKAIANAGGIDDVSAISIAGQQHGAVCLDEHGQVVRPAMLWHDTKSAESAKNLVDELGAATWANATGSVPVASFTVTKLRWIADHEPENARKIAAVCLPHDWLTWRLQGLNDIDKVITDRSDASGTGYFDSVTNQYRRDLLIRALGHDAILPRVLSPTDGIEWGKKIIGPGAGDNAASALGVDARDNTVVSLGTSGTAFGQSQVCSHDQSGVVAGFADATGKFLPLVCTLNASRVLDATCTLLGVDHKTLADLALAGSAGAEGVVLVPYFAGERTPNLPNSTGGFFGLTIENSTPQNFARAAVEGVLCGLADAIDALIAQGSEIKQVCLVGGATASDAVRKIAPTIFGVPVVVPPTGEYVANGAARQAAWVLTGQVPNWPLDAPSSTYDAPDAKHVRDRYADASEHWINRLN